MSAAMTYVDLTQPLKPCPFCGKKVTPRITAKGGDSEYYLFYEIKCEGCKISMSKISGYTDSYKGTSLNEVLQDMAEVINRWNTRGNCNEN